MTKGLSLRRFAPAKINLFLHVGDKRADGFHNLQSLVVFADAGDWLTAAPSTELSLSVSGAFAGGLPHNDDNLVLKSARSLKAWARGAGLSTKGAALTLEKHLPLASGIGGGSSDAAATLLMLAAHWALPIGHDELERLALALGADVPVCLRTEPVMVGGIGETLSAAPPLPDFAFVLVNPRVEIPTAQVFQALRTRTGIGQLPLFTGRSAHDLALWLDQLNNDLEAPATLLAPAITRARSALTACEQCLLSRMSGSGATCFGLFESLAAAQIAAEDISRSHPDWWIKAAARYTPPA